MILSPLAAAVLIHLLALPAGSNAHISSFDLLRCDIDQLDISDYSAQRTSLLGRTKPLLLQLSSQRDKADFEQLRHLTVSVRDPIKIVRQAGFSNSTVRQTVGEQLLERGTHFDMRRDNPVYIALSSSRLPTVPEELELVQEHPTVSLGGAGSGVGFHLHDAAWLVGLQGYKIWVLHRPGPLPARVQPVEDRIPVQQLATDPEFQICVQKPNQLIWLPANWWHATYNEPGANSFTLSFGGQGLLESRFDLLAARGQVDDMQKLYDTQQDQPKLRKALSQAVLSAATAGQISSLEWLRQHGAGLSRKGKGNRQPVHVAAWHGQLEALEWLVKRGAQVNGRGSLGSTPVHDAARSGFVAVLEWLSSHGASMRAKDQLGASAVHLAAEYGQEEAGRWLVQHGVPLEGMDRRGWTPAMMAANAGHIGMLEVLLDLGADLSRVSTRAGIGALHVACHAGWADVVRWLVETAKVELIAGAVHLAAFAGMLQVVQTLEQLGADMESKDPNGDDVLQAAIAGGHLPTIQWLSKRKER